VRDFLRSIPYNFKQKEQALIHKAQQFAVHAHSGQKRKSGEDFIEHPVSAAVILGQIFPDAVTIAATLLHDITEDTPVTLPELRKEFGDEVANLVDGVTKLGHVRLLNSKDEYFVENLRKMFIATSSDARVLLIKLADRIHNMRTIQFLAPEKQLKVSTETLEMYAPIAGRLGIMGWKEELENASFKVVYTKEYDETKKMLDEQLAKRTETLRNLEKLMEHTLKAEGLKFLEVDGRVKRVYALHNKLLKYNGDISKIYDIFALRIITKSTGDCYAALGAIHKHFQPVPGRVKDYIAMSKPNGYSSLHTTVFDKTGHAFEVQFRTDLMHEQAERGIAAHWFYTETGKTAEQGLPHHAAWIAELHAWQEDVTDPEEYLESLKIDLFKDRIFVLTPKGDVKDLPRGATVIDFAFSVHSDLGYHMMGAKINGKMASIYDELQQGNVVSVIKSKKAVTISRDWLKAARTSGARAKIRQYLRENDQGIWERVKELKLQDLSLPTFFRKK